MSRIYDRRRTRFDTATKDDLAADVMSRHSSGRPRRSPHRIIGLALGVTVMASVMAWTWPGTYVGSVDAILLSPSGANVLAEPNLSVADTAGILARKVVGVTVPLRPVANDVSMVDEGILTGYTVRQPQSGGQWGVHFDQNLLIVESAGQTEDSARAAMEEALAVLRVSLVRLQDDVGVAAPDRIRIELSPSGPTYTFRAGSRIRAVIGIVALGGVLCFVALRMNGGVPGGSRMRAGLRSP